MLKRKLSHKLGQNRVRASKSQPITASIGVFWEVSEAFDFQNLIL